MFEVWRIDDNSSMETWKSLQTSPSWEEMYSGLRSFGTLAALNMLDHTGLSTRECPSIFVKLPEAYPIGLGMAAAFPGVNVDYFNVRGKRPTYSLEDIVFRDARTELGDAAWLVSPVNGETLLASAAVDSVRARQQLDTIALTHIIVNSYGKLSTQTKIDQFGMNGFMNFVQEAGDDQLSWYEHELESWGTALRVEGELDYRLQGDIKQALGTAIGAVELGKGAVLFLLTQRRRLARGHGRDTYHPIGKWIHASLLFLEAKYKLDLGTPPGYGFFEAILTAMRFDDLLVTSHGVYGPEYRVSRRGTALMTTVYLPIIDGLRIPARIRKEIRWLLGHSHRQIYNAADLFRR